MRVGLQLPHFGRGAGPELLERVAEQAEALEYDTVWVADRLLSPVDPRDKYPPSPDGPLPEWFKHVLDPLATLTFVAARTAKLRLGTAVLDIPFYNPVVLARQLTTLDILSAGRLRVGLGLGWSRDEFEAAGTTSRGRGDRASEWIRALREIWTTNPVELAGRHYSIPRSWIGPKPVQQPHPPIYLAAFVPAALERAARLADGWLPAGLPLPELERTLGDLHRRMRSAGRDPQRFEVIVQAPLRISADPYRGTDRRLFSGSESQVRSDFAALGDIGIEEIYLALTPKEPGAESFLAEMTRRRDLVG